MQIIHPPHEILVKVRALRQEGLSVGLVPTMGALHEGHQALVERSTKENDITVTSIFVNPTQFNNPDDLAKYPKTLERDVEKLNQWGCDIVFAPHEKQIYPSAPSVGFDLGKLNEVLEGKYRPGHFNGVGIIVLKLFNMVMPDRAYFGLKDFQQYLIVKELVFNLSFPVEVIGIPTVRLESGLAVSSRNQNLTAQGLQTAANIYQGLVRAKALISENRGVDETIRLTRQFYDHVDGLDVEYLEIVNPDTLLPVETNDKKTLLICIAGYVESVRLIDNLYLQPD